MATNFTMEEIRKSVQKDDNARLQKEMQVGQTALDVDQVSKLSRLQLIDYVTTLRFLAGQTESVKSVVQGFDVKTVKFTSEVMKVAAGEAVKTGSEQSALVEVIMVMMEKREKELIEERQREQKEIARQEKERRDDRELDRLRKDAKEAERIKREIEERERQEKREK